MTAISTTSSSISVKPRVTWRIMMMILDHRGVFGGGNSVPPPVYQAGFGATMLGRPICIAPATDADGQRGEASRGGG